METGKAQPGERLELRPILLEFAEAMEGILRQNDYKGGWSADMCAIGYLEDRLVQEVGEYFGNRGIKELLDIANFAMMIWSRLLRKQNINIKP